MNCNCNCGADRADLGRGTTPPIYIDLPDGLVWTDIEAMWITVAQSGAEIITKELDDIETETVGEVTEHFITLSQEETLKLDEHLNVEIQVRARDNAGNAFKSDVVSVGVGKIIKGGVI